MKKLIINGKDHADLVWKYVAHALSEEISAKYFLEFKKAYNVHETALSSLRKRTELFLNALVLNEWDFEEKRPDDATLHKAIIESQRKETKLLLELNELPERILRYVSLQENGGRNIDIFHIPTCADIGMCICKGLQAPYISSCLGYKDLTTAYTPTTEEGIFYMQKS